MEEQTLTRGGFQNLIGNAQDPDLLLKSNEAAEGQDLSGKRSRLKVLKDLLPLEEMKILAA